MKIRLVLSLAIAAALCTVPSRRTAIACDCSVPGSAREAWAESASVFSGRVVAIEGTAEQGRLPFHFQVDRVWKGPVSPVLTVYTEGYDTSCGYSFVVGQSYLVYASRWESKSVYITGLCSRNLLIADAAAAMNELGEGAVPPVASGIPAARGKSAAWFVVAGVMSGILMAAAWHGVWRRRADPI